MDKDLQFIRKALKVEPFTFAIELSVIRRPSAVAIAICAD
jgi:hypothetical protein